MPASVVPIRPPLFEPQDPDYEGRVRGRVLDAPFLDHLSAEITALGPGHCRVEAPYDVRLTQQNGYVHAGAQASLADAAGGGAAASLMPPGSDCLSVEFKVHLLRPAQGDRIVADAYVVRPGKQITVCDLEVHMIRGGVPRLTLKGLQSLVAVAPEPSRGQEPI